MRKLIALLIFGAAAAACRPDPAPSPYLAQQDSPVRGLSSQEVADLLAGRGAGYARTAELNSYPGPRHVIDLGERLSLSATQRATTQRIFDRMQREAIRLGTLIVERERTLSGAFADHSISSGELEARVDSIARLYGRLRATHLRAHLEMTAILSPQQVEAYDRLRGYGDSATAHRQHEHGS
jgi:Spy/CpxP family protein refolding chaperone